MELLCRLFMIWKCIIKKNTNNNILEKKLTLCLTQELNTGQLSLQTHSQPLILRGKLPDHNNSFVV